MRDGLSRLPSSKGASRCHEQEIYSSRFQPSRGHCQTIKMFRLGQRCASYFRTARKLVSTADLHYASVLNASHLAHHEYYKQNCCLRPDAADTGSVRGAQYPGARQTMSDQQVYNGLCEDRISQAEEMISPFYGQHLAAC